MGNPRRILHVVSIMNTGGLETMLINLHREIDRSKVQFDYLVQYPDEGHYDREIVDLGGRIHRVQNIRVSGLRRYSRDLLNFFTTHPEYDIIHSHVTEMSGIVLKQAKRGNRSTTIAHSHVAEPKYRLAEYLMKRYASSFIGKYADYGFACSEKAGQYLFGPIKGLSTTFRVFPNAIDTQAFARYERNENDLREEFDLAGKLVIGHIGRFSTAKNHKFLIEVFRVLTSMGVDAVLLLVGDGPLRDQIALLVRRYGLTDRVKFIGVRDDISRVIHLFDLLVFPSLYEGLGIVLIEAQAAGVPCIVSDRLPKEADMGLELVRTVSAFDEAEWTKVIIANRDLKRTNCSGVPERLHALATRGYDVKSSATSLEAFYLSL